MFSREKPIAPWFRGCVLLVAHSPVELDPGRLDEFRPILLQAATPKFVVDSAGNGNRAERSHIFCLPDEHARMVQELHSHCSQGDTR
jgi:hypothetical protein